jgi:hypothetical protein
VKSIGRVRVGVAMFSIYLLVYRPLWYVHSMEHGDRTALYGQACVGANLLSGAVICVISSIFWTLVFRSSELNSEVAVHAEDTMDFEQSHRKGTLHFSKTKWYSTGSITCPVSRNR